MAAVATVHFLMYITWSSAALEYRSIKLIRKSDGATKGVEHAKKVIDDQLKGSDKDDATETIRYLYLLSLTASRPDHFFMDVYALEKKLSHKTGPRAEVLRQFLVGSRLVEAEFSEFESTPLASFDRASLRPDLLSRLVSSRRASESIYQYAQARSAWLALTLSPFLISLEATELRQAVIHADEILDDLAEKTVRRIGKGAEAGVLITDILTLSLALWCGALRMRPEARFITGADPGKNFAALLDAATGAVLKAAEIKEQSAKYAQNSLGWDFLSNGLIRKLYVVTLASVITAYRSLPPKAQAAVTEQQIKFVNDIIRYSRDLIDFPLGQVRTRDDILSDSLFHQTDEMLTFCELLWDRFGFERLRDFMNVRRVHFNVIGQSFEYKKEVADNAIRESLSAALDEQSFTGLIANVMLANCLKQVEGMRPTTCGGPGASCLTTVLARN